MPSMAADGRLGRCCRRRCPEEETNPGCSIGLVVGDNNTARRTPSFVVQTKAPPRARTPDRGAGPSPSSSPTVIPMMCPEGRMDSTVFAKGRFVSCTEILVVFHPEKHIYYNSIIFFYLFSPPNTIPSTLIAENRCGHNFFLLNES